MTPDKRFVVGLSRTESDRGLAAYARQLADLGLGRWFEFVHAIHPDSPPGEIAAAQQFLDRLVQGAFAGAPIGVEATARVLPGIRIDVLLDEATRSHAGVLLVGHRRSHNGRRSLARRLAMVAPSSIWLIPDEAPKTIRTILAPVDYSDHSADALRVAATVARAAGVASLRVLHVAFDPATIRYEEHALEASADNARHMRDFLAGIDTDRLAVQAQYEEGSDAARTILRIAAERATDLLVLSTRGRSRAASILLGSVTAKVMAESPIAVLAVKHFGAAMGLFELLRSHSLWLRPDPKTN